MSAFALSPTDAAVVLSALDKRVEELQGDINRMDRQPWNKYDTSAMRLELASAKEVRERIAAWARGVGGDG